MTLTPETGIVASTGLRYCRYGSGPPVVFLHGLGASNAIWVPTLERLAPHYCGVAFELPGHGSSPPPATYDLAELAALILLSCSELGMERFALVGHSLGGNIAARMALAASERVERLVLIDSALDAQHFALLHQGTAPRYTDRTHRALRAITRLLASLGRTIPPGTTGGVLRPLARRMHVWQPVTAATMRSYIAALWSDPLSTQLEAIRQPTLLIQGTRDPLVLTRQARYAVDRIPGARLELIRGAFHTPMDERPQQFATLLQSFLDERSAPDE
jgi:pimeloyl-ACP methyl ester carboxylesterase